MSRPLTFILLGLYFFIYMTPQYIKGVYYLYDRMAGQQLILTIINILIIFLLYKNKRIDEIYNTIKLNFHHKSYIAFILFASLSMIVSINITESLIILVQFINLFVAYILILVLSKNEKVNFIQIFLYFTLAGLFVETFRINSLIYDSVITQGNILVRSMEFRGFTGNINISSFALAIKIPVVIYLIFKIKNYFWISLLYILFISAVISIILLFSRAALIVLSIVIFISIFYSLFKRKKILIYKSLFIVLSVLLSMGVYSFVNDKNTSDLMVERFSSVTNPEEDQSVNERLGFYKIALEDIKKNPILGIGIGNWKLKSIQRGNKFLEGYRIPYKVHNDFLEMAAEVGILGGLFFMYFIFYPFVVSFLKLLKKKEITISFLVFLIVGIYIFDSLVNFPMHRPINFIYLSFTFALFYNAKLKDVL